MALLSSGIGIDVSDHHVRIAYVNHSGVPEGLYELVLSPGYIVDDRVMKSKELKKKLSSLLSKSGLIGISSDTVLLVAESRVFSTSLILPRKSQSKEEHTAEVIRAGQKDIPIPFREAFVAYRDGADVEGGRRESVLAVQKDVLNSLKSVFSVEQFPLVAVESNNKALNRLILKFGDEQLKIKEDNEMTMVVDVGHRWTNITVYDKVGAIVFSRSMALRPISEESGGRAKLLSDRGRTRICLAIKEVASFFNKAGYSIPFVIMAGVEGAQKKTMNACSKVTKELTIVRMGEVVHIPGVSAKDIHIYGAAIGAAIRATKQRAYKKDHNFL